MSFAQSYQLPDLTALIRSANFTLRVNQSCSQALRLPNPLVQTIAQPHHLGEFQPELLAALCFPTCDAPQLRVAMDVVSFIILGNQELAQRGRVLWSGCNAENWEALLSSHAFLSHTVTALRHLVAQHATASQDWNLSFASQVLSYRNAQLQAVKQVKDEVQSYLPLRQASSGWLLIFSLIPLVHGLHLEPLTQPQNELLNNLRREAANILIISEDVILYNEFQSHEMPSLPHYNLVSILLSTKGFALQGAINETRKIIQQSIQSFVENEKKLLQSFQPAAEGWFSRSSIDESLREDDVKVFIQGLRDCVAGFVHWMYESEIYFGKRGDEVREFGWVFLKGKTAASV